MKIKKILPLLGVVFLLPLTLSQNKFFYGSLLQYNTNWLENNMQSNCRCIWEVCHFWKIIRADRNYRQRMHLQAMRSNPLSGSIICPSTGLSSCLRVFCDFCIWIDFQCWVKRRAVFIPKLGSEGPQSGPVELIALSLSLSVSLSIRCYNFLSGCLCQFLAIKLHARSTCGHRPWVQIP